MVPYKVWEVIVIREANESLELRSGGGGGGKREISTVR